MKKGSVSVILVLVALGVLGACITPVSAAEKGGDLIELKFELPKPMFVGTPKTLKTDNLEPPRRSKTRKKFYSVKGLANVAKDKTTTGSDMEPIIGEMELVTDGDKEGSDGSFTEYGPGQQHVQIDLEDTYTIHAILVWHYHSEARVYRDVVVQLADDPDFIMNVRTIYNNDHDNSAGLGIGKEYEYIETYEGRLMPVKNEKARYIRLYSNGSTSSEMNHYIEVEVFGKK
jgi:hypothetical protein